MKIYYTKDAGILSIFLGGEVCETIEYRPGLYLDLDAQGNVVGVETHDPEAFLAMAAGADGITLPESYAQPQAR